MGQPWPPNQSKPGTGAPRIGSAVGGIRSTVLNGRTGYLVPPHDPRGDLLDGIPLLSPWLRLLRYRWPVQRIGPAWQPDTAPAQPTCLLARREADGQVRFAELAPLAYAVLAALQSGTRSGRALLLDLAAAHGLAPGALLDEGAALLERLRAQGSVLGTRLPE